jgi:hypothetical protein
MASSGIGERLLREIARNKAKSAALGILCLVACYFWMPLVVKFFKGKNNATPAVQPAETTAVVNVTSAAPEGDVPKFDWRDFLAWTAKEPRMIALAVSTETRDPFSNRITPATSVAAEDQQTVTADAAMDRNRTAGEQVKTPKDYGLQLHSTVVGGRRSSANINGVNYRVGDWVPIPSAADAAAMNSNGDETEEAVTDSGPTSNNVLAGDDPADGFELVEVKPRFVKLQRKGQLFRLELQEKTGVDRKISIRPAKP